MGQTERLLSLQLAIQLQGKKAGVRHSFAGLTTVLQAKHDRRP